LQLSEEDTAEVHFLIEHHLDMSATVQRRDIFDPSTISSFAASVVNQERLQRLCLLTYADIHAVNPERSHPGRRTCCGSFSSPPPTISAVPSIATACTRPTRFRCSTGARAIPGSDTEQIERFIEGFPAATWRYIPRPKLPRSW